MSNSLCRGGLPRPPAVKNCLSGCQCARVVGASRSCRSRRYTLIPLLSVTPLSSPGPRAQHPTSHRVSQLVGGCDFGCVDKVCVGADLCACPLCRFGHHYRGQAWKPAPTEAFRIPFRTWLPRAGVAARPYTEFGFWRPNNVGNFRVGEGRCALPRPRLTQSLHRQRIDQQCTPGCPAAKLNKLCTGRDVHHASAEEEVSAIH